jgi:C_GCAxxG_C_C family probable redox protein
MSKPEEARKTFGSGFNCAQAVFSTFSEKYGVDKGTALRVACAFGAGIGRTAGICGAVTGAVMAISVSVDYGTSKEERQKGKEKAYALTQEFIKQFMQKYGTTEFRDLLKCDLSTAEGFKRAQELNTHNMLCPNFVQGSAEILEKLIS